MSKVMNGVAMGFVRIVEMYPNEYILVRVLEVDYSKGREIGIAIYTASSREELDIYAKNEGLINETTVLQGENLTPVIGGLL
ncbi:MAG: hypothetical protein LBC71_08645 [Oscillospiraceae bacterium]|jgi:hypothetical protein|nr:hypothetical protein [Oscillospiraceae bacterium]